MMGLEIGLLYKEQDIMLFKECYAMEKIDGTLANLKYDGHQVTFSSGGGSPVNFLALFNQEEMKQKFIEKFGQDKVKILGEYYGGKIQGMSGTYGKESKFIAFDVIVTTEFGKSYLKVPAAEEVSKYFGLEFVHYVKIPTNLESIEAEKMADSVQAVRNGIGPGKIREGIVLRPLIELRKNNGERIICKHKRDEFCERQHTPQVIDPERMKVLEDAQAIADEWVVPERLRHVLQDLLDVNSMKDTPKIIKAMAADVYREAKGEIVESKEVSKAIGKKAVELWQKYLKQKFEESVK